MGAVTDKTGKSKTYRITSAACLRVEGARLWRLSLGGDSLRV